MDKDPEKERRNIAERGLSLDLAEQLDWTTALIWEDRRRKYGERRYCVLGFIEDRLHSVVFTPRHGKPRVISLRKANKREVIRYEKAIAKAIQN
ncbi:MAG: BrnT family toxin [Burkholderiales bacterium]|nr:BrnT family toxin [Burkholderiales bacterium]